MADLEKRNKRYERSQIRYHADIEKSRAKARANYARIEKTDEFRDKAKRRASEWYYANLSPNGPKNKENAEDGNA